MTDPEEKKAGRPRRRPLDTLEQVRREIARVYWEEREGATTLDVAKGRAHMLSIISQVIKAERTASDPELEALLTRLHQRMQAGIQ